jgi:hypothetical protein
LDRQSYTFGRYDIGSLDVGRNRNIYTTILSGAFRSEGIEANGYFARETIPNVLEYPHFLPVLEFKQRRAALSAAHAGLIARLPREVRIMIYEQLLLSSDPDNALTR